MLKKYGLIEVAKEEQKGKCTVTYYRRTAPLFLISQMAVPCTLDLKNLKKGAVAITNDLNVKLSPEKEDELLKLMQKIHDIQKNALTSIAHLFTGCVEEEHLVRNVLWFMTWLILPDDPSFQEYRRKILDLFSDVGLDLRRVL